MKKIKIRIEDNDENSYRARLLVKGNEKHIDKKYIRKEKQKEVKEYGYAYCLVYEDFIW